MSASARQTGVNRACQACVRRSWLLAAVGGSLDYLAHDRQRLLEALSLADEDLIDAVGGRRRDELRARRERVRVEDVCPGEEAEAICRHDRRFPPVLSSAAAPCMLHVAGGDSARLAQMTAVPVVAIVGSTRASDYGAAMAASFGRGLAAAGVTVTSGLVAGVAAAAHAGALECGGRPLAVMHGGLGVSCPARARPLYAHIRRAGCAISELPPNAAGRRWGRAASERIVAELAQVTVVIEAEDSRGALAAARIAQALGRPVSALPGPVTSPLSSGTNALLWEGAHPVRGPADVLELLYRQGVERPARTSAGDRSTELEPRLRATLERVGAGHDTPDKLMADGADPGDVLLRLSELELMGLLARGDGGRYLPQSPLQAT